MDSTAPLSSQVRLIDAGFLWTEPHSKRIKMKLTIQKEVRKRRGSDMCVGEYDIHTEGLKLISNLR